MGQCTGYFDEFKRAETQVQSMERMSKVSETKDSPAARHEIVLDHLEQVATRKRGMDSKLRLDQVGSIGKRSCVELKK